jgi:hypothetical protein
MLSVAFFAIGGTGVVYGRSGLILGSAGVRWREKLKSRSWGWQEISDFELSDRSVGPWASVKLVSGEIVPFRIRAGAGSAEADKARELIEGLRARLRYEQSEKL